MKSFNAQSRSREIQPDFFKKGLLSLLLLTAMAWQAQAINIVSIANGNWSSTSTWDCGCVPGPSDNVTVAHNVTLDVDIEVVGPFSLTINAGKSLVGNSTGRRIGYDLTSSQPIVFTNNGTFTIGILNRTSGGSTSNDDWVFNNNGTFTIQNTAACSGSTSPFAIGYGKFFNNSGATLIADGCFYIGGATGSALLDNSGDITFNGDFSAHSTSNFINHPTGFVTCNAIFTAGGLNQDNYGCINAAGGFRVFEKTNNGGAGRFTMHDNSKLIVPAGTQFNVNSNTTLEGVDDDNNNANNGCVSSGVQVNNDGTITGEFYLNDPDGAVGGTVGPNVTLGTGNCGGPCTAATCAIEVTSATPSACNPVNNTYSLSVVVTYSNAPGGNITVNTSNGGTATVAATTSPQTITLTGLTANGMQDIGVTAFFVTTPACTHTLANAYNAPAACICTNTSARLWLVDEDFETPNHLHLWSFGDYNMPTTTAIDYGRIKYIHPVNGLLDIGDLMSDMEAMAVNSATGLAYFLTEDEVPGGPGGSGALFSYDLDDAAANIGNIVLTLVGHVDQPTRANESLAFNPADGHLYFGDDVGSGGNASLVADELYKIDPTAMNANPMLVTNPTLVGTITGLGEECRYVDGLEFTAAGKLYTVDGSDDKLYELNIATGAIIAIADNNINGGLAGSVDVETIAWDPATNKLIGTDNSGSHRFVEITIGSDGANVEQGTFSPGTPGLPADVDFEGSALYGICSVCAITITSATPSACDPNTNTYSLDVVVNYSNAPGGNITVNTSNGGTATVAAATSPQTITLTGLTANGVQDIDVTAFFVNENTCTDDLADAYDAPASCSNNPDPCATPVLWAINEDNGHLFSVPTWTSTAGVNATAYDWGQIQWSSDNCVTKTNVNISGGSELESAAWDDATNEYYLTSNKTLGAFNKPVLLKIDIDNLVVGQQPCAVVIGSIASSGSEDIESLAIDPLNGDLYGGAKTSGRLYKLNKATAAILGGYPVQMTKPSPLSGNLNDSESLTFDESGTLYVSETDDKDVYTINKVTGAGISVFDDNTAPLGLDGLTWDFAGNRLIGFEDGSLESTPYSHLFEITSGNGSNTLLANTYAAGLVDIEGLELACDGPTKDYGDLADGTSGTAAGDYQTLAANNGPCHTIVTGLKIGATVDGETNGQPSALATGDDTNTDDEDGIAAFPTFAAGSAANVSVNVMNTTGSAATLYGFIDWNNNGVFTDANEAVTVAVPNGTNGNVTLAFTVPAGATTGAGLGARFRLSTQSGLTAHGCATDGEVEDYKVWVAPACWQLITTGQDRNELERFDQNGVNLGVFYDAPGTYIPEGIALGPGGYLYVVDANANTVVKHDPVTGALISTFATLTALAPTQLLFGPDGNMYVLGRLSDNVERYNGITGAFMGVFVAANSGGLDNPGDMQFSPDNQFLYISSKNTDKVLKYNATTGAFVSIAFQTSGGVDLFEPGFIEFGPDGYLYISDEHPALYRVLKGDVNTGVLTVLAGSPGTQGGINPLRFGPDCMLYFTANNSHQIFKWNGTSWVLWHDSSPSSGLYFHHLGDMLFVTCATATDYGDLADGTSGTATGDYQTLTANNGPCHTIVSGLKIGATVDGEADGQPSSLATGDDTNTDDEDGIATFPTFTAGSAANVSVNVMNTTGSAATLYGFIDWNNNGVFTDANEAVTVAVPNGTNGNVTLNFTVPDFTATDARTVGARFRLSTQSGLTAHGCATDGEVEDYLIKVVPCYEVLVSDATESRIRRYSSSGADLGDFVAVGSGGLNAPRGMEFGPDGNLYVVDFQTNRVARYNGTTGAFIDIFVTAGLGVMSQPWDLHFGPDGHLYVSSGANHKIIKYNGTTGALIGDFVTSGSGGLSVPQGFAFGPDGFLYVASNNNSQILKYQGPGGGSPGAFVSVVYTGGDLSDPHGVDFGPDGFLYIANGGWQCVARLNVSSGAITRCYTSGQSIATAQNVRFLPDCNIYASQFNQHSVYKFNGTTGVFVNTFAGGLLSVIHNSPFDVLAKTCAVACPTITANAGSNSPICAGNTLNLTSSPSGGASPYTYNWAGPGGYTSSDQNPSRPNATPAMSGTYTVTVTDNNNCTGTAEVTATVNSTPTVTCPPNITVCINAPAFALGGATPTGGTYSGTGVSAGMFNPATAGVGTHTITYNYTDANNCPGSCTYTITVAALPVVNCPANITVCINAPAFALGGATPSGGTYSGTGVSAGMFNPATAGVGVHTITYNYTDANNCPGSCTYTITVAALPVVNCPANLTVCLSDAAFALTGATPTGGTYSGTGVSAGMFNPATAGAGVHTITYNYTDANNCPGSCTYTITVRSLSITSATPSVCDPNTNTYSLSVVVTYSNPPAGNITVNTSAGATTTVALTSSSQTITITGLTANGLQDINVTAFFVNSPGCSVTAQAAYDAPAPCIPCPNLPCGGTTVNKNGN
ncbi:MAG: GEVED domain-containing protein [Saprospiraceae bacterium]